MAQNNDVPVNINICYFNFFFILILICVVNTYMFIICFIRILPLILHVEVS